MRNYSYNPFTELQNKTQPGENLSETKPELLMS